LFTTEEILDIAVKLETNGEKIYRDAARNISSPELVSLLHWMADEEALHAKNFSDMKASVADAASNPVAEEMARELIDNMLGDRSFSLDDVDFTQVESVKEMVAVFIEFEKDTIIFYEMIESFIEADEPRNTIKRVVSEEKQHIEKLSELLNTKTIVAL
jgi:rubrerythrin